MLQWLKSHRSRKSRLSDSRKCFSRAALEKSVSHRSALITAADCLIRRHFAALIPQTAALSGCLRATRGSLGGSPSPSSNSGRLPGAPAAPAICRNAAAAPPTANKETGGQKEDVPGDKSPGNHGGCHSVGEPFPVERIRTRLGLK